MSCCPSARGPGPNQLWRFSSAAELLFLNSAHAYVHQPKGSFLCHPQEHHPPLGQDLLSAWSWTVKRGWLVTAPGVLLSAFPLHGFWWSHSGSGTCRASTSLTSLSPQPQLFFFPNFIAKKTLKLQLPSLWLLGVCLNYYGHLWRCSVESVGLAEVNAVLTAGLVLTSSCVQPLNRMAPLPFFPYVSLLITKGLFLFILKFYFTVCVHVCASVQCMWVSMETRRSYRQLWAIPVWVLGTKL